MKKILFLITLSVPVTTFAYQPLVSDSPLASAAQGENLQEFLVTVFNWGIGLAVALAILFIIFGGIQYMTTDAISGKKEGRDRITAAVVGLLIALSSWLILNQINPKIFKNNLTLAPLPGGDGMGIPLPNNGNPGTPGGNNPPTETEEDEKDTTTTPEDDDSPVFSTEEQVIRNTLTAQGVTINKNPCTSPTQTDCTNVKGFRQSTMNAITAVNTEMGGKGFVITGGTEHGHSNGTHSHGNGYKFDIGQGSNSGNWNNIDNYFKGLVGSSNINNNVPYTVKIPSSGQRLEVMRETSGGLHWDIKALP